MLPILIEWGRTGTLAWIVVRTEVAGSDIPVMVFTQMLAFVAMLLYFALPIHRRRPSPGACILGYLVLPDNDEVFTLRRALTERYSA
jgi:hypothetical protein